MGGWHRALHSFGGFILLVEWVGFWILVIDGYRQGMLNFVLLLPSSQMWHYDCNVDIVGKEGFGRW
jgi:hypothetical protein